MENIFRMIASCASIYIVVLEKTLESPLDSKEVLPVHSEGDQPWGFFGRNVVIFMPLAVDYSTW